jgi:phage shock protein A
MASIMERIRMIVRSEASDFVERHEDAEKVINQTIADAMVSYASLKKESSSVFEGELTAQRQVEELRDQAEWWHNVARKALVAGDEADARTALSREQDLKERLTVYQGLYDQAHEVAEKYRKRMAEIEDGISQLQAKMARVKAREAAVRATDVATGVTGGSDALDRLDEQSEWSLAEAEGRAEAQRVAESDPFEELAREQTSPTGIDEALAALREQIGE